jgi:cell division protein FtsB
LKQPAATIMADELTKLGIRLTAVESKIDMLLERCNKAVWKSEDLLQETKDRRYAKEQQVEELSKKVEILANAVRKLAKEQGRLPDKVET